MDIRFLSKIMLVTLLCGVTLMSCAGSIVDTKFLLDASTKSVSLPAEGGTAYVTVTSNGSWSIDNSANPWLQLAQTNGSSGSTKIQLTAGHNVTGSMRSAVLNISSQNGQAIRITVSQGSPLDHIAKDPNFYIFLAFGQSNMQGMGAIESQDKIVNNRFKVFQTLNCSNLNRSKSTWYTAVPPTCQCNSGLSPVDYFGRTMVANLPDSITIGIINVAVAGSDIRLFDKNIYMNYDSTSKDNWFTSLVASYEGNPYQYLIKQAKLAQKNGVIKGILLHQGETNTGQEQWPTYVKKIYNDMLTDLSLDANSVPLLAGELFSGDGNCCSGMNSIIRKLPNTIPTAHIISSANCTGQDAAHFDSQGYRKLGERYGVKMLELLRSK
ncbi:hypothetical protein HDC90_004285 [Pedobacter sp. AK013]|uniref:sialate O-acetylesterase n=1 Tax=Pedobacter sp. AK013 TaxID=2723071 RepID=UPI0018213183|nr:sialate O-acetylesterase [Pedobacter sp. AK013]MBB6239627.1 hypothetical protein [Pedobacter sp. AK013]